jgi:hypothetical protein
LRAGADAEQQRGPVVVAGARLGDADELQVQCDAGDFPLAWRGWLGYDVTDNGPVWNAQPNVSLVSVPATNWLKYSCRWARPTGSPRPHPIRPRRKAGSSPGSAMADRRVTWNTR